MKNKDLLLVSASKLNLTNILSQDLNSSYGYRATNPKFPLHATPLKRSFLFIASTFKSIFNKNSNATKLYNTAKQYPSKIKKIKLPFSFFLSVKSHNSK